MVNHTIIQFSIAIGWLLKIYYMVHIAAFVLSWIQADPNNQIVYYINRSTIPMWNWVGRHLPRSVSAFSPICAVLLILFGEIVVPGMIRSLGATFFGKLGMSLAIKNIGFYVAVGTISVTISIVEFILFLAVLWFVFSLVNPPLTNPIVRAIMYLIDPLITPIQRILPRTRVDWSPVVLAIMAFFARNFLTELLVPISKNLIA